MIMGNNNKPSRGVFWLIDGHILAVPYSDEFQYGVARSGNTYNHKLLWAYVKPPKCNKPFDYYPRGRVDFTAKGKPIIYMNANIDVRYVPQIMNEFGLEECPIIRIDGSDHYKCYLDRISGQMFNE